MLKKRNPMNHLLLFASFLLHFTKQILFKHTLTLIWVKGIVHVKVLPQKRISVQQGMWRIIPWVFVRFKGALLDLSTGTSFRFLNLLHHGLQRHLRSGILTSKTKSHYDFTDPSHGLLPRATNNCSAPAPYDTSYYTECHAEGWEIET